MLIVHATSTDPAGSVINFVNALNAHTKHRARLITTARIDQYGFASDIADVYDCGDEIEALLRKADIIHLHKVNDDFTVEVDMKKKGIKRKFCIADVLKAIPGKKVVHHIHGHPYERANAKEVAAEYAKTGRKVLASTPDLQEIYNPLYNRVQYFPNCVPINDVRYLPRESDRPIMLADGAEKLFVMQTPTNAVLKNIHVIEGVMKEIGVECNAVYIKIWKTLHEHALRHKRNAHVVFDHMEGYYGLSSLEALSMGKPTCAGLSAYTQTAITEFFGTERNPWVLTRSEAELREKLILLLKDKERRTSIGAESRKFMEEVWSDRAIAERLAAFYESL